jgi:GNAT superfamily N-acetyltransferase
MREVRYNDLELDQAYLAGLNACFGSWGDQTQFAWVFERSSGSHPPDRMAIVDDGEFLAGSGISYRLVCLPNGASMHVGIMTGSWTLPAARGRGIFTTIVDESRQRASDHGCGVLLAFVTHDNPSRRALERAGSAMVPTWYMFGAPEGIEPASEAAEVTSGTDETGEERDAALDRFVRFHYPTTEAYRGQFLQRPAPVEARRYSSGIAIVELSGGTDRVLSYRSTASRAELLEEIAADAVLRGRRLFLLSTCEGVPRYLEGKQGFLTALVASEADLRAALGLDTAVPSSSALADPLSPYYLGPWFIEAGDRM